ncbi:hypothetical protein [Enterococcus faecium]|uniref:hypothetical protein n=1 Tax=Enterococcus faecium TaxID=1352 RepID=UPI0021FBC1F3|nr:hypothetical protein [Enterococcus faecium]BDP92870.1 hypothetical protein EfmGK923_30430 [Enterococcus faecium]BDP96062.1 hypothetical protein EfmGK941_30670 [Enterococcus faecium]BDP99248.1 hypothetical protein EfmGK961_30640 [Enterococcus faecium]
MAEVEFGSKEWFEELNAMISFPEKFSFYYNKKDNIIQVSVLETKGKLENTRWSTIKPSALKFHPKDLTAVVAVKEVNDAQEYYEEVKKLKEIWCDNTDLTE